MADGDHIASSTNVQVRSRKRDQTRIGHSMQIPITAKGLHVKNILITSRIHSINNILIIPCNQGQKRGDVES